jgi:organic radical activating enzyme/uncharacterized protein YuzB (UPF0349 family)
MLMKITNRCHMNCLHCSESSTPDGMHMNRVTFGRALNFIKKMKPKVVSITGGEPTEHPDVVEWIQTLKRQTEAETKIMLLSNGTFVYDEVLLGKIMRTGVPIQITNDKRFYPTHLTKRIECERVVYEASLRSLVKLGRARENWNILEKPNHKHKAPTCFNLRSVCSQFNREQYYRFDKVIEFMEFDAHKFCQPSILVNGDIVVGEHVECAKIGSVFNYIDETLIVNASQVKCNKCGLEDILEPKYRKFINLEE